VLIGLGFAKSRRGRLRGDGDEEINEGGSWRAIKVGEEESEVQEESLDERGEEIECVGDGDGGDKGDC